MFVIEQAFQIAVVFKWISKVRLGRTRFCEVCVICFGMNLKRNYRYQRKEGSFYPIIATFPTCDVEGVIVLITKRASSPSKGIPCSS